VTRYLRGILRGQPVCDTRRNHPWALAEILLVSVLRHPLQTSLHDSPISYTKFECQPPAAGGRGQLVKYRGRTVRIHLLVNCAVGHTRHTSVTSMLRNEYNAFGRYIACTDEKWSFETTVMMRYTRPTIVPSMLAMGTDGIFLGRYIACTDEGGHLIPQR